MAKPSPRKRRFTHGLLVKTMAVLIIIFVIPMLLLYSLLLKGSTTRMLSDVGSHISVSLQILSSTMDEIFTSVESMCNQMRADTVFGNLSFSGALNAGRDDYGAFLLREQVSRKLYQYYLSNSYIYSLDVYNPFCDAIFTSKIADTRKILWHPADGAIQRIVGQEGHREKEWFWEQEGDERYLVTYFSPYYSNRPTLKLYARIALSESVLTDRFNQLFPEDQAALMIVDASRRLLTPGGGAAPTTLRSSAYEVGSGWYESSENGETYLTVYRRARASDWLYAAYAPLSRFNTSLSVMNSYFYYFLACLVVILLISMAFLYTQIIRPMQKISAKMRQAENGDFSVRIRFRQKDELGYVGHRFNVLLENIQNLIQENYETRMLKNEFELKFIQTQLKEHFIYNTLDAIHWIADKHKVPQISDIIFNLSHFFRLTLNHGSEMVTVAEAREILTCYLSLINVRMDDMIAFTIQVEPGLEAEQVVKYLFQPVVENAFQHGIRSRERGSIRVSMTREGERMIRYQVEDDGIGMTPQRLEAVRYAITHHAAYETREDCFALINIDRQLKMYFGSQYTYEIDSQLNRGTRVTLIFPLGKENRDAENDHH